MPRKSRAIVKRAVVFLIAGAIVNLAVAWGIACARESMTVERNQGGYFAIRNRPGSVVLQQRFGMTDLWWRDTREQNSKLMSAAQLVKDRIESWKQRASNEPRMASGRTRELMTQVPRWGTFGGEPLQQTVVAGGDIGFGFPAVGLWMQTTCDFIDLTTTNVQLHGGWRIRGRIEARANDFIALPLRPIWPGFAINTIFYAAILWVMFATPGRVRRAIRCKRGLCPACAYPVGASPVCTECGAAVDSKVKA